MNRKPQRRGKLLRCIPPASVLRERLRETEQEIKQLKELLRTAKRIEAAEAETELPPQQTAGAADA